MSRAAVRVVGGIACLAATAAGVAATLPLAQGPALPPRKPGFMLYLSQPLGGGGGAALHPKFGFRLEQVRMTGNNGAPDAGDPMQHRALIGWQMDGHRDMHFSDMRLELGNHVTYDIAHRTFGVSSRSISPFAISGPRATASASVPGASGSKPAPFESRMPPEAARGAFAESHFAASHPSLLRDVVAAAVNRAADRSRPGGSRPEPAYRRAAPE